MTAIHLTSEQHDFLQANGNRAVRAIDPQTNEEYVLLRADEFARLQDRYDADSWTDEEMDLVRAEAVEALGWEGMEAYQDDQP